MTAFCTGNMSSGAPHLARFSRDVGYHSTQWATLSVVIRSGVVTDVWLIQDDERRLCPATTLYPPMPLSFVIPSEAEGSAVRLESVADHGMIFAVPALSAMSSLSFLKTLATRQ